MAWLFAITYPQAPPFTENQNTKFLHGAADSGFGFLKDDWTATTADPLPLFSLLVRSLYAFAPVPATHGIFIVLTALYAHSLIGLGKAMFQNRWDRIHSDRRPSDT